MLAALTFPWSISDQGGQRLVLQGNIDSKPALLIAERAAFETSSAAQESFVSTLTGVKNLGANDIYHWYLASSATTTPSLKLNLIYPCTEQHVKKYSPQGARMVTETPEIYKNHVRPYMQKKREEGKLNWVWNIIEGKTEQEEVMYREHGEEGFLILPDM